MLFETLAENTTIAKTKQKNFFLFYLEIVTLEIFFLIITRITIKISEECDDGSMIRTIFFYFR